MNGRTNFEMMSFNCGRLMSDGHRCSREYDHVGECEWLAPVLPPHLMPKPDAPVPQDAPTRVREAHARLKESVLDAREAVNEARAAFVLGSGALQRKLDAIIDDVKILIERLEAEGHE